MYIPSGKIISPRDNRLTRFRYNSLPWDQPERYVYVRDKTTGKFWSLIWGPTHNELYELTEEEIAIVEGEV
ncbi:MAG: hypothetical protein HY966_04275 [Ignavibacteriales bacterium]|nr:hypothetical protein [Ignavibacteriales bacterium]